MADGHISEQLFLGELFRDKGTPCGKSSQAEGTAKAKALRGTQASKLQWKDIGGQGSERGEEIHPKLMACMGDSIT